MDRNSPFHPDAVDAYHRWRDARLAAAAETTAELVVEISDPFALTDTEQQALQQRIADNNMAIYACHHPQAASWGKGYPAAIAKAFGLTRLDRNYLADDDGITAITVNPEGEHPRYIPYTNRPINWHTDGYYNTTTGQIRSMVLHCVRPATTGGVNALMDPELLYIALREHDMAHIRTLMQGDVMTIPAGVDGEGNARGDATGPVFSVHPRDGALHMRYTARKRNIQWREDPATSAARAAIDAILGSGDHIHSATLEAGMGLLCHNVLHNRSGFEAPQEAATPEAGQRLLYRARYLDRMAL